MWTKEQAIYSGTRGCANCCRFIHVKIPSTALIGQEAVWGLFWACAKVNLLLCWTQPAVVNTCVRCTRSELVDDILDTPAPELVACFGEENYFLSRQCIRLVQSLCCSLYWPGSPYVTLAGSNSPVGLRGETGSNRIWISGTSKWECFPSTQLQYRRFFYIYFTALHVSVLGPSSSTHIFHRIYSIDSCRYFFFHAAPKFQTTTCQ
jgi:hypothetical protein